MDAKQRLRLYLEQRRELGESEMVLDSLSVDDVLRMIGAPAVASPAKKIGADADRLVPGAQDVKEPSAQAANASSTDIIAEQTKPPEPAAVESERNVSAQPEALPPADPPVRFSTEATTDWRTALRTRHEGAPALPLDSPPGTVPSWLSSLGIPFGLSAFPLSGSALTEATNSIDTLDGLASMIAVCRACPLGATALNPVPGEGNHDADFVCVGEAPGQTEDETGRPFVGAAGQLLTKILGAIQLPREEVFICNVLKHRPPGNRNPQPDEVRACSPYLVRQLALLKPKVILALGTFAAQTLLNTTTAMGKLRGQIHRYDNIPLIVTYHPSALLRNENWKRPAWDDVRLARRVLDAARLAMPASE